MAVIAEPPGPDATRFGPIHHVAETGSTNADLLAEAEVGAEEGAVLVADHQTAGRGRQSRSWHDDPGNALLVSVLLRPPASLTGVIPLIAGLAAVDALAGLGAARSPSGPGPEAGIAGLKWPNDVLAPGLGERKLAGILAEALSPGRGSSGPRSAVVVGMGMNLRWGSPPPPEIGVRAATVVELLDRPVDRDDILRRYLVGLERWLARGERLGVGTVLAGYRSACLTLGRRVRFVTSEGERTGRAVDLTENGLLVLELDDGVRVELSSGDAHHLPLDPTVGTA